ncbi:hypothetical protein AVEN_229593-1 [Araneus ventricosus]|uniref:Uncharacterized protein n=1 Tax=Araneus ventricosus TaxID=182803 RepID=A0A4Y2DDI9_ARAVE|nr:hypothetical protein AVEN_229593-1 [Araneus ventricosus]
MILSLPSQETNVFFCVPCCVGFALSSKNKTPRLKSPGRALQHYREVTSEHAHQTGFKALKINNSRIFKKIPSMVEHRFLPGGFLEIDFTVRQMYERR